MPGYRRAISDWGAENPTALSLPFVADIVRADLGASLTQPIDSTDKSEIAFQIKYGDTTAQIAADLQKAGLVTSARAFVFESIEKDATSDFIAGRHVVSRSMTIDQIIKSLTSPAVSPPHIKILFREGCGSSRSWPSWSWSRPTRRIRPPHSRSTSSSTTISP